MMNRQVKLARRPVGLPQRADFRIEDAPAGEPGPGEVRVVMEVVSLDPAMRGWMSDAPNYAPPIAIGGVMRGYGAGRVDVSNHPDFEPGDAVVGAVGIQSVAVARGDQLLKVDTTKAPLARWIGGLGMTGRTAYFGTLDILKPTAGETMVVSAAAGSVGSIVGQICKMQGARVVGIAGGHDKCRHVVDVLGFDACVDYKAGHLARDLLAACPDGIDGDFENVGGDILDTVMAQMNVNGRIVICGLIAAYSANEPPPGPRNMRAILTRRLTIRGMVVSDWRERFGEANAALADWYAAGKLKLREDKPAYVV